MELNNLRERLGYVAQQDDEPELSSMAKELLDYVTRDNLYIAPDPPERIKKAVDKMESFQYHYVGRPRYRALLTVCIGAISVAALYELVSMLVQNYAPGSFERTIQNMMASGLITGPISLRVFLVRIFLQGILGLMLLSAAMLLAIGKERKGIYLGFYSLLLSLTTVDILIFYFNQFSTIAMALFQFILLLLIMDYRNHYIRNAPTRELAKTPEQPQENVDHQTGVKNN
jgi:hypothetical protein